MERKSRQSQGLPPESFESSVIEYLLAGINAGNALIGLYDGQDVLRFANPAFRHVFQVDGDSHPAFETMVRRNHDAGVGMLIRERTIDDYLARARARRRSRPHRRLALDLIDGRRLWWTETVLADGWLLCNAVDVTVMKEVEASLRISRDNALEASQTDFLTRLPNRRQCFAFLEQALSHARVQGRELSIAMVDIDYFKSVNDRFGHSAGDLVLCHFADVLRANLRASDMVARIGGEEFMIIWPDASLRLALDALHRLRDHPIVVELPVYSARFNITFSAGVARARPADTIHSLVSRADRRMYAAKARGRVRSGRSR